MMKRLLMVLLIAGAALAQQPPEEERGSRPGLAYRSEGLDQTNLFNGTVTLNVPLGQTYPVGGALTYGLIASYATNDWTEVRHEADGDSAKSWWTYRYPSRYQNAGLGWVVTLGKIVTATISSTEYYLAPDGGHHEFDPTLHPKDTPTSARYTRDGTYLRKQVAPNGTRKIEFPNGTTHTFDSAGDVTDIADAFGNWVHVDHTTRSTVGGTTDPYPDSPLWIITDSVGRTHRIFFRPGWDYVEEQWDLPPVPHDIVDRVELAAFDDPATPLADVATYTFVYDALPESLPDGSEPPLRLRTSRRSSKRPDPEVPDYVLVPILTSIQMPHGLSYSFTTDRGDQTTRTSDSGNLRQMVLPTGGRIDWTYQAYSFSSTVNINRGVLTRTVSDTTGRIIGSSDYVLGELSRAPDIGTDYSRTVITRDAAGTALTATRHYFTGCDNRFCSNAGAYGLPFTVTLPDVRGYRSSEILKPGPDGELTPVQRRSVEYEADLPVAQTSRVAQLNARMNYDRTTYLDDGSRWAGVAYSLFDGLGHYRLTTTDGSFAAGNLRTTFTNFNADSGTFVTDAEGNQTGTFVMPSTGEPWLLNRFDRTWTEELTSTGASHTATEACFDTLGFQTSVRRFVIEPAGWNVAPSSDIRDLLAVFTRDGRGNLIEEQYFGGDQDYVGAVPAPAHDCGATHGGEQYRIDHSYQYGRRAASWYVDSASPLNQYIFDAVVDRSTGLVSTRRSRRVRNGTSALEAMYRYDLLGRVRSETSPTLARTYEYPDSTTIEVTDRDRSTNGFVTATTSTFDVLGRRVRETRSMPDRDAVSTSDVNVLGWATQATAFGAARSTVTTYDERGRPTLIQVPGQSAADATRLVYTGTSKLERTTKIRTGGDDSTMVLTPSTTTEEYDRQGRLRQVTEPNGTVTRYGYGAHGSLTSVCANATENACAQTRSFVYDGRGLLTSETHPESGTTTYSYDARGHARSKHVAGSAFDTTFTYDKGERLVRVDEKTGTSIRPLKVFAYGSVNGAGDWTNGQLTEAWRYNWLPIGWVVQVLEEYAYQDPAGQVSQRTTSDWECNATTVQACAPLRSGTRAHRFVQTFSYDASGATKMLGYPTCTNFKPEGTVDCGGDAVTATNIREAGWLTGVSSAGGTAYLDYHDSGLLTSLSHTNGVSDLQEPDPDIPSRPLKLETVGAIYRGSCVAPTFSRQPESRTATAGTMVTLTAEAGGEDGLPVGYAWYEGAPPDKTHAVGTGASISVAAASTTYWVEASNTCGSSASATATISICTPPDVTPAPAKTISAGQTITLRPTIAGTAPLKFQWYTVNPVNGAATIIAGATADRLTIHPSETTTYRIVASNDCGSESRSTKVTVLAPPSPPTGVTATFDASVSPTGVRIAWNASVSQAGIVEYIIRRGDGRAMSAGNVTSYTDSQVMSGKAYVYRIYARDQNDIYSELSTPEVATVFVFTDDPIVPGFTEVKASHMTELRRAVDAVRAAVGLPAAWTTYNASGDVTARGVNDVLEALNEARLALGLSEVVLTDPVATGTVISARTFNELRGGVR